MRAETWLGTRVAHEPINRGTGAVKKAWPVATLASDLAGSRLPTAVSCHTSLHFLEPEPGKCPACAKAEEAEEDAEAEPPGKCTCAELKAECGPYAWRTIYARDGKAVVIEKTIGKGTIVLSALSYFVSNEAMRNERHPALLLWLVGGKQNIIFDEFHHGISGKRGVGSLMRKYRLHWLGLGLILLAGLFVWKNSVSLVPPEGVGEQTPAGPVAQGKDSASGLVNLLRRNISRRDILGVCVDEYKAAAGRIDRKMKGRIDRVAQLMKEEKTRPARQRDETRLYSEICKTLNER